MSSFSKLHPGWSDLQDAAWQTLHQFKHGDKSGAEAVALFIDKSPATLSNMVNPDQPHKLSVDDAQRLALVTNDPRMLQVFAGNCGYAVVKLPDANPVSDKNVLAAFARWQSDLGVTNEAIHDALEDGHITTAELDYIRTSALRHMGAFFEFLQTLEKMERC